MNKKILYKLLLIFALLACTLFISNTKSFATDESTTVDSLTVTLYDGSEFVITNSDILSFKNIFVLSCRQNGVSPAQHRIYVYCSNDGAFSFNSSGDTTHHVSCVNENLERVNFYIFSSFGGSLFNIKNNINSLSLENAELWEATTVNYFNNSSFTVDSINYSSYDVLTYDYSNECTTLDIIEESTTGNGSFFQQPPVEEETPVEEKQETTLAPIVEDVETKKTLAEVVGILPLIIVVVVFLVGLRKALKMLLAVLHRA